MAYCLPIEYSRRAAPDVPAKVPCVVACFRLCLIHQSTAGNANHPETISEQGSKIINMRAHHCLPRPSGVSNVSLNL